MFKKTMGKKPPTRKDPNDQLPASEVRSWAIEKHERLRKYITATSAVRRKYTQGPGVLNYGPGGAAFIDVYCGPGRAFEKDSQTFIDGSSLVAQRAGIESGVGFTDVVINDKDPAFVNACEKRLQAMGVSPVTSIGAAEDQIVEICRSIPKYGFSVAFIDPFGLVPFKIIKQLSTIKRIDLIIHVSTLDLKRNLDRYFGKYDSPLEAFAPGITDRLELSSRQRMRHEIMQYWNGLVEDLGFTIGQQREQVLFEGKALYELVIASRVRLADKIWSQIAKIDPQSELSGW